MPGTLFVVATPIGNLEDLTFRALRTLQEADVIAAEDTRRTAKLLAHYQISKPLRSLHAHNEDREATKLIERMVTGTTVALVSDAGTPGIADPGARLVARAREAGVRIVPVPGPSAVTAALSVAGFPADQFVFMGFPPSSGAARENWLEGLAREDRVTVFYEAPHRIRRTIGEIANFIKRPIFITREISKVNEEWVMQPSVPSQLREQGEFTVIIGPSEGVAASASALDEAADVFWRLTESAANSEVELLEVVAAAKRLNPSKLRNVVKKQRIERKRRAGTSA